MSQEISQPTTDDSAAKLDRKYEFALSRIDYQTGLLWSTYNAYLLATTVLLGFIATALAQGQGGPVAKWFVAGGSAIGSILCILWWANFEHNYAYYRLSLAQARRLEAGLGTDLLSQGHRLSEGRAIPIDDACIQINSWALPLRPHRAAKIMILLFGIAFSALFGLALISNGPLWK